MSQKPVKRKKIWIDINEGINPAIQIDWDNDRHNRIEIWGETPVDMLLALEAMATLLRMDIINGELW